MRGVERSFLAYWLEIAQNQFQLKALSSFPAVMNYCWETDEMESFSCKAVEGWQTGQIYYSVVCEECEVFSETNASYLILLAHKIRGWCW